MPPCLRSRSAAIGTGAGSSPFDDFMPWQGMEEYNIINSAVVQKGQSDSPHVLRYDGLYPRFYYKIVYNSSQSKDLLLRCKRAVHRLCQTPVSGRYVGHYNTISGYASKSGANPLTNITRATARANSEKKGSKGGSSTIMRRGARSGLKYLVEYANWDSQSKIGNDIVGNSSLQKTGTTDSMTYHTGTVRFRQDRLWRRTVSRHWEASGAMSMTGLTASASTTARLISAPIRRSTQTIQSTNYGGWAQPAERPAISKRSETARPYQGICSDGNRWRQHDHVPDYGASVSRHSVFSASAAAGLMLRTAACSFFDGDCNFVPRGARSSARASPTSPNRGPGAARWTSRFQSGIVYALARQRHSIYPVAKRGAYIFLNNAFRYFLPFSGLLSA